MPNRSTFGFLALSGSVLAAVVIGWFLATGAIEATRALILVAIVVVGLSGGVVLLGMATGSVSTAAAVSWAVPGVVVVIQYSLIALQYMSDSPLGLGRFLVAFGMVAAVGGAVSPLTSIAASSYAWRSRRLAQIAMATLSWLGALAFWGKASGLILQSW